MLDFVSTLSIFLLIFVEIIFTVFCVKKIQLCEKYVDEIHLKMLEKAKKILEINDEISKTLKKINKVIRILNNKKLHQIKRFVMMSIDIVQTVILIKSLNIKKGTKIINYSVLKKIAFAKVIQQIIRKILDSAQNLCAI